MTGYRADIYDWVTSGSLNGDIEWYLEQAKAAGGDILEVGAGTGRVTLPLARAGCHITALDIQEDMLQRLRERAGEIADAHLETVCADMRSFQLGKKFAAVFIPHRSFLHNRTREDQLACLACIQEHLQPGGVLALNIFHPALAYMSASGGAQAGTWRWSFDRELEDGRLLMCSEAAKYDTVKQELLSCHRYELFDAQGKLAETHLLRLQLGYLYEGDIRGLLEKAGFVDIEIFGGFGGQNFSRDGEEMVVRCRRC